MWFNKEIEKLINSNPNDKTLQFIKNYKRTKQFKDYYNALDSFGFMIKFGFTVIPLTNSKYIPCLKYYQRNDFGELSRTIELVEEDNAFKSLKGCYKYLAKE